MSLTLANESRRCSKEMYRHAASMHNPVFYERQRMRASTWNVPRFLHSFDETIDGGLVLPRGLLGTVASGAGSGSGRVVFGVGDVGSPVWGALGD
jgi:hypothetical protein